MCRESREDKECLLTKSRKDKKDRKRIVVAATGASGLPILKMCLQIIREDSDYESILILSDSAKITLQQETKDTVEETKHLQIRYVIQKISEPDRQADPSVRKEC